jgi:hypothetical protein
MVSLLVEMGYAESGELLWTMSPPLTLWLCQTWWFNGGLIWGFNQQKWWFLDGIYPLVMSIVCYWKWPFWRKLVTLSHFLIAWWCSSSFCGTPFARDPSSSPEIHFRPAGLQAMQAGIIFVKWYVSKVKSCPNNIIVVFPSKYTTNIYIYQYHHFW